MVKFWNLTPRETAMVIEAAAWRMEQERQRMVALAWHVEALHRSKRLPSLASLLRPRKPAKRVPIDDRRREFEEMRRAWQKAQR